MKAIWWYRISSLLLILFATGHTLGFRRTDAWPDAVKPVVAGMRTVYFPANGFLRSYWDFYVGFGLFVTVMMLFAALVAWQMAGLPQEMLSRFGLVRWGLAIAFAIITAMTWRYFFLTPLIFSIATTATLTVAAMLRR
ncbi:LIC_13387 family protein [Terriglobus albidus]|uniref:LIC_13387 family protein n=1 Tax=Terriglobus albidus TaxID=1592106 RepID=UPI0021DFD64C|nr:hypothetical protein [Terriglobus albidus]